MEKYKKNSLSLKGAVALGTGVMIGAGIFALLGQVAELSGTWFPYIFIIGALISGFSAYSYIKVSNAYPSAGGIAMILMKTKPLIALGTGVVLAAVFAFIFQSDVLANLSDSKFEAIINSVLIDTNIETDNDKLSELFYA